MIFPDESKPKYPAAVPLNDPAAVYAGKIICPVVAISKRLTNETDDPIDAVCAPPVKYFNESATTTAPRGNDVNDVDDRNASIAVVDGVTE
jgi:hypothetical protein